MATFAILCSTWQAGVNEDGTDVRARIPEQTSKRGPSTFHVKYMAVRFQRLVSKPGRLYRGFPECALLYLCLVCRATNPHQCCFRTRRRGNFGGGDHFCLDSNLSWWLGLSTFVTTTAVTQRKNGSVMLREADISTDLWWDLNVRLESKTM